MNSHQKYLSSCLLMIAALLYSPSPGWAQTAPNLGAAASFAVLGDTVTCVGPGSVTGDVGADPTFTPGACVFDGATPPAVTSIAAAAAQADFTTAYNTIQAGACIPLTLNNTGNTVGRNISTLAGVTLAPGTYCLDDVAKTGLLTLNGPASGIWIFKVVQTAAGDLTGTDFTVTMAGGGLPCNVFWAPVTAATMTRATFKGTILAGNLTVGSITTTDGSLIGRALANVAVSLTRPSVIGCGALAALAGTAVCKDRDGDDDDKDKEHRDRDRDRDRDKDKDHGDKDKGHGDNDKGHGDKDR